MSQQLKFLIWFTFISGLFLLWPKGLKTQTRSDHPGMEWRAKGTGRTTGHIADLIIYNRNNEEKNISIGPLLIPSVNKYQGYVVNGIHEVTIPRFSHLEIALMGYCTNVFKPAVPEGVGMTAVENWVGLDEALPIPGSEGLLADGFIPLGYTPSDSIWLTYPGTQVLFPYKIDFDKYPASAAALLIQVVNDIEKAVEDVLPIIVLPGDDDENQKQTLIQHVFWQYTARLSGGNYPFTYFKDRLKEQVTLNTEKPESTFPSKTNEEVADAAVGFWSAFELVGAQAKLSTKADEKQDWPTHYRNWMKNTLAQLQADDIDALDQWLMLTDTLTLIDKYLDQETVDYARRILQNGFAEILQTSIRRLNTGDADFFADWQKIVDLTTTDFFEKILEVAVQINIREQLQKRITEWSGEQIVALNPTSEKFLDEFEGVKTYIGSDYLEGWVIEETRHEEEEILTEKVKAFFEEQLRQLEASGEDRLKLWLATVILAQTDWFWSYLDESYRNDFQAKLGEILQSDLLEQASQLDPENAKMIRQWLEMIMLMQVDWISDYAEAARSQINEILSNKLRAYIDEQIDQLDPSNPDMFQKWLELLWLMQVDFIYDYLQNDQKSIDQQLKEKIKTFFTEQIKQLSTDDPDFISKWAELDRALSDDWMSNYLNEEESAAITNQLNEKFTEALFKQVEWLNPWGTDFIRQWRTIDQLTKTHWFDGHVSEDEKTKIIKSLQKNYRQWEKTQSKTTDGESVNWEEMQLTHPTFKIPVSIPASFPVWIPIAGGTAVAGGILLLTSGEGKPTPQLPIARDDAITASCNSPVSINVLTNDTGEGLLVASVNAPGGNAVTQTGGTLQIGNSGAATFAFTYTIRDQNGQTATATVTVTVTDGAPPSITCPGNMTIDCTADTDPVNTGQASAEDNCDPSPSLSFTDINGGTACEQLITRTWTASDQEGNVSACTQIITLIDEEVPTITCPADVFISTEDPKEPATTGQATATDNCSPDPALNFSDDESGLTTDGVGELKRNWTAVDACGQTNSCTQIITITKPTVLTITCPEDITIDCDETTDPENTGQAMLDGDCPGSTSLTYSEEMTVGGCSNEKIIQRTWKGVDECGNEAMCIQTITIRDEKAPDVVCPASVNVSLEGDITPAVTGQATATDNCSVPESITINFEDATDGLTGCAGTGLILRTWIATDECGNTGTCTQEIRVEDKEPPLITCPFPAIATGLNAIDPILLGEATAIDNSSTIANISISYEDDLSGLGGCGGILRRRWIATDACGNVSDCIQDIIIDDTESPVITCPARVEINCNEMEAINITGMPIVSDNYSSKDQISISFTDNREELTPCGGGDFIRTWVATDACENTSSCEQVISVRADEQVPELTCPVDVKVDCGQQNNIGVTGAATVEDNCAMDITLNFNDDETNLAGCEGFIIRTWSAIDPCGNAAACEQMITINSGGILNAQLPESGCFSFPIVSQGYPISPGLNLHQQHYDRTRTLVSLRQSLPEHPALDPVPDFKYHFGPAVGVSIGYSPGAGNELRLEVQQNSAIGTNKWTVTDGSGEVPVVLQSPFRSTVGTLSYHQVLSKGRLQPVVGIGAQWHQLFLGNSILQIGQERQFLKDGHRLQEWNLVISGGLQMRLDRNLVCRLDGGGALKLNSETSASTSALMATIIFRIK